MVERPRYEDFPALKLATQAGMEGGTLPAVLNAANEVAVATFLEENLDFPGIWRIVEETMNAHDKISHPSLDEILDADHWAREYAETLSS